MLQVSGGNPSWTGGASQSPGDLLNRIIRDIEWHELRDDVIVLEHFDVGDDQRRVLFLKHVDERSS